VDLADGHLLPGFDATTDGNTPACLYRNGLLYLGGHFENEGPNASWVFQEGQKAELTGPGSAVRVHVAAVDATTGAVDAWNPSANSTLGLHVLAQSPTQIAAGGDFTRIGARDQAHLGLFSLDTTPPDTILDSKPPAVSSSAAASFGFHSTEGGGGFLCSLDGALATGCTSPVSLSGLADGPHGFSVGAIDPAGNPDPSPASYSWTIDTAAPGAPTGPATTSVTSSRVDLAWTASPDADVASYQVLRDGYLIGTTSATSYADQSVAGPITYNYSVVAVDRAGNASPATDPLTVDVPSQTAPPIFADGFESGDLTAWTSSTGLTVQSQEVFSGASAARATPAGVAAYAQKQLPSPLTELFYDLHFKVLNQNATKITLGSLKTSTNVGLLSLYTSSLGKLGYRNDRTAMNVVSTTQVSTASWHDLQIHLLVNGTASEVEVWLDGVRVPDLARTESLGTVAIGRVQLGDDATGKTYDVAYDQVAVASSFIVPPPPPGAPTGVTATPGDRQATVGWTAPASSGGGPITGYTITVSPGGAPVRAGGLTTSTVVGGLTNGTSYTFTVTATNDYGTGPPSAPSNTVIPATVPGPPLNVVATAGDGMAMVTWSAPASDGGRPVTGYAERDDLHVHRHGHERDGHRSCLGSLERGHPAGQRDEERHRLRHRLLAGLDDGEAGRHDPLELHRHSRPLRQGRLGPRPVRLGLDAERLVLLVHVRRGRGLRGRRRREHEHEPGVGPDRDRPERGDGGEHVRGHVGDGRGAGRIRLRRADPEAGRDCLRELAEGRDRRQRPLRER